LFRPKPTSITLRRRCARSTGRRECWGTDRPSLVAARLRLDLRFNPAFTAPLLFGCRHHGVQRLSATPPDNVRWFDLRSSELSFCSGRRDPSAWGGGLWTTLGRLGTPGIVSAANRRTTLPPGVDPRFFDLAEGANPSRFSRRIPLHPTRILERPSSAFRPFPRHHPEYPPPVVRANSGLRWGG